MSTTQLGSSKNGRKLYLIEKNSALIKQSARSKTVGQNTITGSIFQNKTNKKVVLEKEEIKRKIKSIYQSVCRINLA